MIVLVHGIRTYAGWVPQIREVLENAGFIVEPTNYGYLDVLRFIIPIAAFHRAPINKVWDSIRTIRRRYPNAEVNILAHSFGTYVVANILSREFDFRVSRVAFCGSIIGADFPFNRFIERATWPVLNEVGCRDVWPALTDSVTSGYGSTGTYGFRNPLVRDRWHRGYTHSQFLTADFCERFWVPFFRDGTVKGGDVEFEMPPLWLRVVSILKIKYLVLLCVVGAGAAAYALRCDQTTSFDCYASLNSTEQAICCSCSLAAKDRELDLVYQRLRDALRGTSERNDLRDQENSWLRDERDGCKAAVGCIARVYEGRIARLHTRLDQMRNGATN